eukprot:2050538-Prymnesium_polylepis.1
MPNENAKIIKGKKHEMVSCNLNNGTKLRYTYSYRLQLHCMCPATALLFTLYCRALFSGLHGTSSAEARALGRYSEMPMVACRIGRIHHGGVVRESDRV